MAGLSLVIPAGSERVPYRIADKSTTLRFCLRTFEPSVSFAANGIEAGSPNVPGPADEEAIASRDTSDA